MKLIWFDWHRGTRRMRVSIWIILALSALAGAWFGMITPEGWNRDAYEEPDYGPDHHGI